MIFNFDSLYKDLIANDFEEWQQTLPKQLEATLEKRPHGKTEEWRDILGSLPEISASHVDLNTDKLHIGISDDCSPDEKNQLESTLKKLHPVA